jgi:hypothetical protein
MAKAKTLPKLTDEELLAPLPAIKEVATAPAGTVSFQAQKTFLEARINQVLSEEMSEANIVRVEKLKKAVVGWRTSFTKSTDDYMKAVFKAPMSVYKAAAQEVLSDIDKMESKLDEVLSVEENKRIANLNTIFDGIEDELQEKYALPDRYKERVERKKAYYYKTAKMSEVSEDIEEQYKALAKEFKNYQSSVKTVTALCKSDRRLNVMMYIDHLAYSELPEVMDEIEAEKERLANLDKEDGKEPVADVPEEKIEIGVKVKPMKSDFPGLTKTMTLQITYGIDLGDELTRVFSELQKNGVKMKVISCVDNTGKLPVF